MNAARSPRTRSRERRCSASRRAMKVESSRSLRGPSSNSSDRKASRSTAIYRSSRVTTAVRKTVCPDSRFISPSEARRAMADDLVAGRIEDRHLALDDRDEGVALVADAEQHVTNARGSLLSDLAERRQLRLGQPRTGGNCHYISLPPGLTPGPAARPLAAFSSICLNTWVWIQARSFLAAVFSNRARHTRASYWLRHDALDPRSRRSASSNGMKLVVRFGSATQSAGIRHGLVLRPRLPSQLLAEAIRTRIREDLVIATKLGWEYDDGWSPRCQPIHPRERSRGDGARPPAARSRPDLDRASCGGRVDRSVSEAVQTRSGRHDRDARRGQVPSRRPVECRAEPSSNTPSPRPRSHRCRTPTAWPNRQRDRRPHVTPASPICPGYRCERAAPSRCDASANGVTS